MWKPESGKRVPRWAVDIRKTTYGGWFTELRGSQVKMAAYTVRDTAAESLSSAERVLRNFLNEGRQLPPPSGSSPVTLSISPYLEDDEWREHRFDNYTPEDFEHFYRRTHKIPNDCALPESAITVLRYLRENPVGSASCSFDSVVDGIRIAFTQEQALKWGTRT